MFTVPNLPLQYKRINSTRLHICKTLYCNGFRKRKGTESMKVTPIPLLWWRFLLLWLWWHNRSGFEACTLHHCMLCMLMFQMQTKGGRSHFFRLRLHSCSKIFETGSWSGIFFKFENPISVQTPATTDPTEIYQYFYLRNDQADSSYCQNWKVTTDPGPVFRKFLTPGPGPNKKCGILLESTPDLFPHLMQTRCTISTDVRNFTQANLQNKCSNLQQCFSDLFASRTTLCNKKILGNTKQNFIITQ